MGITLITGGARSGKSSFALKEAMSIQGKRTFIATAIAFDNEMEDRIRKHVEDRDKSFFTIEEPYNLDAALHNVDKTCNVAVIDCLTVWIGNLMYRHDNDLKPIRETINNFTNAISSIGFDLVAVANETGMGIVPENKSARIFRDLSGSVNQMVASMADRVFICVCGIPVRVK
jgi:adenosylcobinamide kinase / adenosylcobinamide-phosphate guanylyltransferase